MVVEVVSASGEVNGKVPWFAEDEGLGAEAMTVVSVLGAQGSGKSTLLNALLGTGFSVAKKGSLLGAATTRGVVADKAAESQLLMAFDVEGADGRERAGREGKKFAAILAGFAGALSDVVLLNLFANEVGNVNSTVMQLLEAMFAEMAKGADDAAMKTALVLVVRDADEDVAQEDFTASLVKDVTELWSTTSKNAAGSLDKFYTLSVVALPHYKYAADKFKSSCEALGRRLLDRNSPDFLSKTEFSKGIPADGFAAFAKSLWDSVYASSAAPAASVAARDIGAPSNDVKALSAADVAFSTALAAADAEIAPLKAKVSEGEKVDGFGAEATGILERALDSFDDATGDVASDSAVERKRRELESVVDIHLHSVFLKNLQLLREGALQNFKNAVASEQATSDFAFFNADSNFESEAKSSLRAGSDWSYASERTDLHSMMQDISSQQKRLLNAQLTAGQQQSQAMAYLHMQQQQLQQVQQQSYGGTGAAGNWNVGAAYRPPDTNVNLSLGYQQGRTNIQISMVPDEQASLLGPNGFTAGVGPANLGLSFNINL